MQFIVGDVGDAGASVNSVRDHFLFAPRGWVERIHLEVQVYRVYIGSEDPALPSGQHSRVGPPTRPLIFYINFSPTLRGNPLTFNSHGPTRQRLYTGKDSYFNCRS